MRRIVRLSLLALGLAFVSLPTSADVIAVRWFGQVYDLSSTGGPATLLGESGVFGLNALARDPSGDLYAAGAFPTLYTISPVDGHATAVANITLPGVASVSINALTFAPTGELYALNSLPPYSSARLFRIDPVTGAGTSVATIPRALTDLAFASDGTLYGWDVGTQGSGFGNGLVRVNPTTGAVTDVSSTVGGTTDEVQALTFDHTGVTLFGGRNGFNRFDRQTAARTTVPITNGDDLPFPLDLRGMAFVPEPASAVLLALGCVALATTRRTARH